MAKNLSGGRERVDCYFEPARSQAAVFLSRQLAHIDQSKRGHTLEARLGVRIARQPKAANSFQRSKRLLMSAKVIICPSEPSTEQGTRQQRPGRGCGRRGPSISSAAAASTQRD